MRPEAWNERLNADYVTVYRSLLKELQRQMREEEVPSGDDLLVRRKLATDVRRKIAEVLAEQNASDGTTTDLLELMAGFQEVTYENFTVQVGEVEAVTVIPGRYVKHDRCRENGAVVHRAYMGLHNCQLDTAGAYVQIDYLQSGERGDFYRRVEHDEYRLAMHGHVTEMIYDCEHPRSYVAEPGQIIHAPKGAPIRLGNRSASEMVTTARIITPGGDNRRRYFTDFDDMTSYWGKKRSRLGQACKLKPDVDVLQQGVEHCNYRIDDQGLIYEVDYCCLAAGACLELDVTGTAEDSLGLLTTFPVLGGDVAGVNVIDDRGQIHQIENSDWGVIAPKVDQIMLKNPNDEPVLVYVARDLGIAD